MAVACVTSARHVRAHVQSAPLAHAFEPGQLTGVGEIADPARHARGRPAIRLEEVLDLAFDVQAPDRLVRAKPQRLERDGELHGPSVGRARHGGVPDAVPVARQALRVVGNLAVRACPGRIHLKEKAVTVIEERIEHDGDAIVDIEIRVACELR